MKQKMFLWDMALKKQWELHIQKHITDLLCQNQTLCLNQVINDVGSMQSKNQNHQQHQNYDQHHQVRLIVTETHFE